jgi:hypothetical protein
VKLSERADLGGPSLQLEERTDTPLRPWLVAWLGLPVLGIANGALRDATYKQATGELAAHQLSTATVLALMGGYLWVLGVYNLAEGRVWAAVPLWTLVGRRSSGGCVPAADRPAGQAMAWLDPGWRRSPGRPRPGRPGALGLGGGHRSAISTRS